MSKKKEFARWISYRLARIGIGFCDFGAMVIPLSLLYTFANFIGWMGYRFARKHRQIAMESLTMAFGKEKPQEQIEKIARDCFRAMASTAVEFFMFMRYPERIKKLVQIEGLHYLDEALAKGKGVVALSAHFGSFPLLLSRLALAGYPIHSVLRRMRDSRLDKFFEGKRDGMGVGSIYTQPRKECVAQCLKALRKNEIVFIQLDQNFGTGGVFVDFFGEKAATATGPIVLSVRTGASIVPMFIHRVKGPRHKIVIKPALTVHKDAMGENNLVSTVSEFTLMIENYIRQYPHEWGWIHKRWKARPKEEKQ